MIASKRRTLSKIVVGVLVSNASSLIIVRAQAQIKATPRSPLIGKWKAIDTDTNKAYAIIEFIESNTEYKGYVRELFTEPSEEPNPKCAKTCPAGKAGLPVIGLEVVWGLRSTQSSASSARKYVGGKVLLPEDGLLLGCSLEIGPDLNVMMVQMKLNFFMSANERWVRVE